MIFLLFEFFIKFTGKWYIIINFIIKLGQIASLRSNFKMNSIQTELEVFVSFFFFIKHEVKKIAI